MYLPAGLQTFMPSLQYTRPIQSPGITLRRPVQVGVSKGPPTTMLLILPGIVGCLSLQYISLPRRTLRFLIAMLVQYFCCTHVNQWLDFAQDLRKYGALKKFRLELPNPLPVPRSLSSIEKCHGMEMLSPLWRWGISSSSTGPFRRFYLEAKLYLGSVHVSSSSRHYSKNSSRYSTMVVSKRGYDSCADQRSEEKPSLTAESSSRRRDSSFATSRSGTMFPSQKRKLVL